MDFVSFLGARNGDGDCAIEKGLKMAFAIMKLKNGGDKDLALSIAQMALEEFATRGYTVENGCVISARGYQRKLRRNKNGYLYVQFHFTIEGTTKQAQIFVHRLVAYLKFGREQLFEQSIIVRHLDDVKQNNSSKNIEIGTHEDNMEDAKRNGKSKEYSDRRGGRGRTPRCSPQTA